MRAGAVPLTRTTAVALPHPESVAIPRVVATAGYIAVVVALAFGLRAGRLSTYGFSEDEINKVRAIEQYRRGTLSANAEHPMLMKLAMWASVDVIERWNRIVPAGDAIDIETAVRLPNAVAGAATSAAVFGLGQVLFDTPVAMLSSLLWASDVNAIAINRIGKEDTFALFFFLVAVWAYERAKRQGQTDPAGAQSWYTASGAAFGLLFASKYFPQYLGVYALFNGVTDRTPGANRPKPVRYFGAMAAAFLAGNFAVLAPATWKYCLDYLHGATVVHHGYPFAGHLYANTPLLASHGIPATFYLQLLGTKVPLVILGAVVAGLIETYRRRRERGFVLLQIWLGLFLLGYSLAAVKFLRYALPLFAALDILAAVGVVAGVRWLMRKRWLSPITRASVSAAALTVSIAGPLFAQHAAEPFYSLFRNVAGEHVAGPGETFPEETYDYGVREAVESIAAVAEPGAAIVSDAPAVVAYYVEHSPRPDLRARSLSSEGLAPRSAESFVIVQTEHVTFENREALAYLTRVSVPWQEFYAHDALAAQVFRIPRR
jgi:hypothetical protein